MIRKQSFVFAESLCALLLCSVLIAGFYALLATGEKSGNHLADSARSAIVLGNIVERAGALPERSDQRLRAIADDEWKHAEIEGATLSTTREGNRIRVKIVRNKRTLAQVLL